MSNEAKKLVEDLLTEHKRAKAEFQLKAQEVFKLLTSEFFNKNPAIKSFNWIQIIPYFNDGEECVFSVYNPVFTNAQGEDRDCVSSYGEWEGDDDKLIENGGNIICGDSYYFSNNKVPGVDFEYIEFIENTLTSCYMSDVMRSMFGTHVKITATAEGFDIEDYTDHD